MQDRATRDDLITHLSLNAIQAVFHYVPLHSSPKGRTFGYEEGDLPVTEDLSGRLLRLPVYYEITEGEQQRVVAMIEQFMACSRGKVYRAGKGIVAA